MSITAYCWTGVSRGESKICSGQLRLDRSYGIRTIYTYCPCMPYFHAMLITSVADGASLRTSLGCRVDYYILGCDNCIGPFIPGRIIESVK